MAQRHDLTYKGTDGQWVNMKPVPLRAADWEQSLTTKSMSTLGSALAQQELGRMYRLFERFGAWLQPMRTLGKQGTVWELRFPATCHWRSGPREASAWMAMRMNYERNKRFPGYDMNGRDKHSLENLDSVVDEATGRVDRKLEEARHEAQDQLEAHRRRTGG